MLKKIIYLLPLLSLLLMGATKSRERVVFTIINKSGRDIAISLKGKDRVCINKCDSYKGEIYYLPVPTGDNHNPSVKAFELERNTYGMQLYYIQTWDPVYGYKCPIPLPNTLSANRDLRLTVLPCTQTPKNKGIGEPTMWKYLPYPITQLPFFMNLYWKDRYIY